jgi:iron(III) transport system ATP-binding protein
VADFVGKTNLLPATRDGADRVQVGEQRFQCPMVDTLSNGARLRVFFRPEDVTVRGVNGSTPNSAAAVVEKVEFLGAYSRITFRLDGIAQALTADLSLNDMEEFDPKPGDTLRVALPPGRLRVFADA